MTVTSTGGEVTDALSGKLTFEQSKNRIVGRDANNLPRLLILADGTDFVMKVSKDAINVLTGADSQMIFNSNNNIFKIVSSGTTTTPTYTVNSTAGQWVSSLPSGPLTIPHGLGYVPGVIAYVKIDVVNQYILLPSTFQSISGPNGFMLNRIAVNVDATNLYILDTTITNGSVATTSAGGLSIKYYLLQESAT